MTRISTTLAAILAMAHASSASAQSFTFQSQAEEPSVMVSSTGPDGKTYGAAAVSGAGDTLWADGKKSKYTYKCISMSQPPRDAIFMSHMMCDVTAPDGTFAATFGCNAMSTDEMACVGGLAGKTGTYTGRRGGVTSHGKANKSTGTGAWYP
jgi:hypothetical protein